jgi:hypothetical protein
MLLKINRARRGVAKNPGGLSNPGGHHGNSQRTGTFLIQNGMIIV